VKRFLSTLVWIILILGAAFALSAISEPYVSRLQAFIAFTVGGALLVFGVGSYSGGEGPLARIRREHPDDDDA
jgi:predicted MFS family arabinose efflux permease